MATEKLQSRIRREQIAQAALSLVANHGLRALSMGAVARRVGLVPSAIYRHFKNKDQVLDAAIEQIGRRLTGNVQATLRATRDPLERLHRLLLLHIQQIRENRAIPRIVFSEDVYGGHPERRSIILNIVRRYLASVSEIVRQGQKLKQIRRDLDPENAALLFLGLFQPAGILWHITDGGFDVTKHATRVWRVFVEAIRAR
jgi:AcrR family transcriptional regulator